MAKQEGNGDGGADDGTKKRKASRACQSCQKAHLTCSDVRPCQRCIKRGDECVEGMKKKARYLLTPEELEELAKNPPKPKRARVSKAAATQNATSTTSSPPPTTASTRPRPRSQTSSSSTSGLAGTDQTSESFMYPNQQQQPPQSYHNFAQPSTSYLASSASPSTSAFPYSPFPSAAGLGPSSQRQLGLTPQQQQQQQRSFHSIPKPPQSSERMGDDAGEDSDDESSSDDEEEGVKTAGRPTRRNSREGGDSGGGYGQGSHAYAPNYQEPPPLASSSYVPRRESISHHPPPLPPTSSRNPSQTDLFPQPPPPPSNRTDSFSAPILPHQNSTANDAWAWEGAQVPPPWEGFHHPSVRGSVDEGRANGNGNGNGNAMDAVMADATASLGNGKGKGKEREVAGAGGAYDYSVGYKRLLEFASERFGQLDTLRLVRCLAEFRPKMLSMTLSQTPETLAFQEQAFQLSLADLTATLLPLTGTPTALWRRTGELVAVGQEFSILSEWGEDQLLYRNGAGSGTGREGSSGDGGGKEGWEGKYVWQILEKRSVVEYFEHFSRRAFDSSSGEKAFQMHATLLTPTGRAVSCCATLSVRRDMFDLPSLIIGQFLPLL